MSVNVRGGLCDYCYGDLVARNLASEAVRKAQAAKQVAAARKVRRERIAARSNPRKAARVEPEPIEIRICAGCKGRFWAYAPAQTHCSLWCAYPR